MMKNYQHIFFGLLLTLLVSCKKNKDETPPAIEFLSPGNQASFEYMDNVTVKVRVTDNQNIEKITVQILHNDFTPLTAAYSEYPDSDNHELSELYILDDIHMETGTYWVKCVASDGKNDATEYREINISGAAKETTGIYVVTNGTQSGDINVSYLDSITPFVPKMILTSAPGGLATNSYHQQVISMGGQTGDLIAADAVGFMTEWSRANQQNPPYPYFNAMSYDDEMHHVFVSTSIGSIAGYDHTGIAKFSASSIAGFQPFDVYATEDFVFSEQLDIGSGNRELVRYFRVSGALDQTYALGFDVKGFGKINNNEILLVGDDGINSYLRHYTIDANTTWTPHTLPGGVVNDVVEIYDGYIVIAHSSGLYSYSYGTNTLLTLAGGMNFTDVDYDEVGNMLWASEGTNLYGYDLAGSQLAQYQAGATIHHVSILYNK